MPLMVIVSIIAVAGAIYWILRSAPYQCPKCGAIMQQPNYCHRCGWSMTRHTRE